MAGERLEPGVAERFEAALRSPEPLARLRDAVSERLEARERAAVGAELERFREFLADQDRDADEDVVLEVMDFLVGWSSPHTKLAVPVRPAPPGAAGGHSAPSEGVGETARDEPVRAGPEPDGRLVVRDEGNAPVASVAERQERKPAERDRTELRVHGDDDRIHPGEGSVRTVLLEPSNPFDLTAEELAGLVGELERTLDDVEVRLAHDEPVGAGVTLDEVLHVWLPSAEFAKETAYDVLLGAVGAFLRDRFKRRHGKNRRKVVTIHDQNGEEVGVLVFAAADSPAVEEDPDKSRRRPRPPLR